MPVWSWPGASITRVIDGDSVIARLTRDIGFNGTVTFDQRLRLNRINAAPRGTELGQRARAFVVLWLDGQSLNIDTVKPYKYGDEWMAEVFGTNGGNLSDALVTAGHAVYWNGTGPRPGG